MCILGKLISNRKIYNAGQNVDKIIYNFDDISIFYKDQTNITLTGGILYVRHFMILILKLFNKLNVLKLTPSF